MYASSSNLSKKKKKQQKTKNSIEILVGQAVFKLRIKQ